MGSLNHNLLQNRRTPRVAGMLAFVLCATWSAYIVQQGRELGSSIETARFQRDFLLSRQALPLQQTATARGSGAPAAILDELNHPWSQVIAAAEAPTGEAVTLLQVDPDPKRRQLAIRGRALALDDALGYLDRLQGNAFLKEAHLEQHQNSEEDGMVSFVATATWGAPR